MRRRMLAIILALVLVAALVPVVTVPALSAEAPPPVVITLDSNYPGAAVTQMTLQPGAPLSPAKPAVRWGYTFSGWYLDAGCTQPLSPDAKATGNIRLYAGWTPWTPEVQGYMDLYWEEAVQGKYIMAREPAYEQTSFNKYVEAFFPLLLMVELGGVTLDQNTVGLVYAVQEARKNLKPVINPESVSLYIWRKNHMPCVGQPPAKTKDPHAAFGYWDNTDFRPFLVPYILKDQSKVKGNIILVAGGGYTMRSNYEEAYPAAKFFNSVGYNAFVLQRRVLPFAPDNSSLDLQRAVRYIRHNAEWLGIAKSDIIIAAGWSGGGGTLLGAVQKYYGSVLPTVADPTYKPDEIDRENSDLSAMIIVYSGRGTFQTDNPNVPPAFIVAGTDDSMFASSAGEFYNSLLTYNKNVELHLFAGAPHGFGMGTPMGEGPKPPSLAPWGLMGKNKWLPGLRGADQWGPLCALWLDVTLGYLERQYE